MRRARLFIAAVSFLALFAVLGGVNMLTASAAYPHTGQGGQTGQQIRPGSVLGPFVSQAVRSAVSPPLASLPTVEPSAPGRPVQEVPMLPVPRAERQGSGGPDSVLQKIFGPLAMPSPIVNVDGMYNYWGSVPPDTNGDVGPNHYVQMVNATGVQVFDKNGNTVAGPYNFNLLFSSLGGLCASNNNGDPIILHDQLADRWFLSQFAFTSQSGPTYQCIAISTSPDPTGPYYVYAFQSATTGFDDYPKYGVWPDAYYMTANRFNAPGFAGANIAYERDRMLRGDPSARMVVFLTPGVGGGLPTDMDGGTLPPPGSPNYFLFFGDPTAGVINEYRFHVDWSNPSLSTFTGPFPISVAPWDDDLCPNTRERCIPQPNTTAMLEAISDRFMHRLAYRNFGSYESLVVNHTVDADGNGRAGVRWYEIRDPNGTPTAYQQGTFAPNDGLYRWMGSIAMDRQGNIIAGYSVSSSTLYPSIRYAGRLVSDPPGQFSQGEATLITGTGSMDLPAAPRWGDYSSINIDPRDDCTFWYTTEYYRLTGGPNWRTRIGSFRFPGCVGPTATPVPTSTGTPPTATPTATATPTLCAGGQVITGSITNADPTQVSAVVGGVNGVCGVSNPCPGVSGIPGGRHYDAYTFTNTSGSPQCVTVSIDATGCVESGVGSVAYLDSFDPNNVCTNYLAHSNGNGPRYTYGFTVPAGRTYIIVVRELSPNIGCVSYTLRVNPCTQGQLTPTPTGSPVPPTATPTATPSVCIPNYQAVTATATIIPGGTDIGNHCDDCTTVITLPFPVSVYGMQYSLAYAGSNGSLQFGVPPNPKPLFFDGCVPINPDQGGPFLSTLFPHYDDLRTDVNPQQACTDCGIFTQTLGSPPNRQFVIRWKTTYYNHPGTVEFEVVLSENSPVLSVIYGPSNNSGAEAAAGIQYDLNRYTSFSCDTPDLTDGLRVDYVPTGCATPTPTATATPTATPTELVCEMNFTDVPTTNPFYIYIRCLYCRGILGGYNDPVNCAGVGTPCFRPENPTTRGQMAKIVANAAGILDPIPPGTQTYTDVPPSHPFWVYIERLSAHGIVGGYSDGTFRPDNWVTRGQLTKFASNAAGFSEPIPSNQQTYTDVPPSQPFYVYIERLSSRGIISGYQCGVPPAGPCDPQNRPWFLPDATITRGQTSKIVSNTFFPVNCAPRGR